MKMTKGTARAVVTVCRRACGGLRDVEVGERSWPDMGEGEDGFNFLLWGEGHDLDNNWDMGEMIGKEIKDSGGWVALDCYCYYPNGDLDCNVYVLIDPDGKVVYASRDDLGHAKDINDILVAYGHAGYTYQD